MLCSSAWPAKNRHVLSKCAVLQREEGEGQGCPRLSLCGGYGGMAFSDDKDGSPLLKQCHKSHWHGIFVKLGLSCFFPGVTGKFPSDFRELDATHSSAQRGAELLGAEGGQSSEHGKPPKT